MKVGPYPETRQHWGRG